MTNVSNSYTQYTSMKGTKSMNLQSFLQTKETFQDLLPLVTAEHGFPLSRAVFTVSPEISTILKSWITWTWTTVGTGNYRRWMVLMAFLVTVWFAIIFGPIAVPIQYSLWIDYYQA